MQLNIKIEHSKKEVFENHFLQSGFTTKAEYLIHLIEKQYHQEEVLIKTHSIVKEIKEIKEIKSLIESFYENTEIKLKKIERN